MTMDVQKYQSYEESSPESNGTNLCIESARTKISPHCKDMQYTSTPASKPSKRSFDVAFLMMPDEKFNQKQSEKLRVSKQLFANQEWDSPPIRKSSDRLSTDYGSESSTDIKDSDISDKCYDDRLRINNNISPSFGSEINIDVGTDEYPSRKTIYCSDSEVSDRSRSRPNSNESATRPPKFLPESPFKNKVFDDPTIISMQSRARFDQINRYNCLDKLQDITPKSAFTKVTNGSSYTMTSSPNPSVSPDNLVYQNSISPPLAPSPPRAYNKTSTSNALLSPTHHLLNGNPFFKSHNLQQNQNYMEAAHINYLNRQNTIAFGKSAEYQQDKHTESGKPQLIQTSKMNNYIPFRSDIPAYLQAGSSYPFAVQNFQASNTDFMKFSVPPREPMNPLIANPAAAILSTLLPPTLAAFSLPAQNVCAKCNISFRMTSDLVYHMRTHHKSEVTSDPNRRKREEKLKCPVCAESFRERHHLTRHMTAHQDKEGDLDDVGPTGSQSYTKNKNKQFFNGSLLHK